MFLSIFLATCRPQNIKNFLEMLQATCDDPTSFEVLIKLDEGDEATIAAVEACQLQSSLIIKCLVTPKLQGYYSLHHGYNELLKVADQKSYFCWLLTDEIVMNTQGWDKQLKKYIKFYQDDIFRVKLSFFQLKNYQDILECMSCPDNYALTTKKWLEIAGGWGDFWGPDSWHQCVDYFLTNVKNALHPFGIFRSFPVMDLDISGQEAGVGVGNQKKQLERAVNIYKGWGYHSTHKAQLKYSKIAHRLAMHIHASALAERCYYVVEYRKKFVLLNEEKECLHQSFFAVPKYRMTFFIGYNQMLLSKCVVRLRAIFLLFLCNRFGFELDKSRIVKFKAKVSSYRCRLMGMCVKYLSPLLKKIGLKSDVKEVFCSWKSDHERVSLMFPKQQGVVSVYFYNGAEGTYLSPVEGCVNFDTEQGA